MNGWAARKNIETYEKRLRTETAPERRRVLEKMLAQQQQILAGEDAQAPSSQQT